MGGLWRSELSPVEIDNVYCRPCVGLTQIRGNRRSHTQTHVNNAPSRPPQEYTPLPHPHGGTHSFSQQRGRLHLFTNTHLLRHLHRHFHAAFQIQNTQNTSPPTHKHNEQEMRCSGIQLEVEMSFVHSPGARPPALDPDRPGRRHKDTPNPSMLSNAISVEFPFK